MSDKYQVCKNAGEDFYRSYIDGNLSMTANVKKVDGWDTVNFIWKTRTDVRTYTEMCLSVLEFHKNLK